MVLTPLKFESSGPKRADPPIAFPAGEGRRSETKLASAMPSAIWPAKVIYLLKEAQEFFGVKEYSASRIDYDLGN
jgi:hypothetical protein